ncbi:MAG TPA: AAA family ATPase, partial [Planctomycetaceae bacterium]|nr:AAA family ATPase [Planctomycetaceae bacterium]
MPTKQARSVLPKRVARQDAVYNIGRVALLVNAFATGDFTHPQWFQEIQQKLVPAEPGLFRLRDDRQRLVDQDTPPSCRNPVRFVLQVEISTIYKKNDRTRKIHHVIYVPGLEEAQRLIDRLSRVGNLASDGRPILGLDSRDLLEITLECGDGCYLVPAHVWTPWFALFGSQSGFDDLEECYGDLSGHIFALETGLSSDPPMNWRWSRLDGYALVSNSDAHSPAKIAREACAFDTELDYFAIRRALETRHGYRGTVEFFPEEGKYHLDGHRKCGVRLEPSETRRLSGLCPECGKRLTIGVMHRVETLADRPEGARSPTATPFRSFIPLPEVLSEIRQVGEKSKTVQRDYEAVLAKVGPELYVLDEASEEQLLRAGFPVLAEAVMRMRAGRVIREAGYDGQYGTIRVFEPGEIDRSYGSRSLFGPGAEPVSPNTTPRDGRTPALVA